MFISSPSKVSIVGSGDTQVESESGERQDLDSVAHQRHFVEGWLSVEDDIIIVSEMSFNFVAWFKMGIRSVSHLRDVDLSVIVSDDVLSSRPSVRAIAHKHPHVVDVLSCHCLWHCQVQSNSLRDSKLVKHQDWIWSDDSSSGEVNSLSHQVPSESTFLSFQSRSNSFQRLA